MLDRSLEVSAGGQVERMVTMAGVESLLMLVVTMARHCRRMLACRVLLRGLRMVLPLCIGLLGRTRLEVLLAPPQVGICRHTLSLVRIRLRLLVSLTQLRLRASVLLLVQGSLPHLF